jgi:hypothetical protein
MRFEELRSDIILIVGDRVESLRSRERGAPVPVGSSRMSMAATVRFGQVDDALASRDYEALTRPFSLRPGRAPIAS